MRRDLGKMLATALIGLGLATAEARADLVAYGISDDNKIHAVDLTTQTDTVVFNTGLTGSSNTNSVAYDVPDGRLFYRSEGNNGALYEWDMAANVQHAVTGTTLPASSADAAFYQGKYWYASENGDSLYSATLNFTNPSAPQVSSVQSFAHFEGSPNTSFGYGDIVITAAGLLYGASNQGFYRVDVSGATPTGFTFLNTSTMDRNEYQLALSPDDSTLFAHDHDTGKWYTINLASGVLTPIASLTNPSSTFTTTPLRDLSDHVANTAVPEPAGLALLATGLVGIVARRTRGRARRA